VRSQRRNSFVALALGGLVAAPACDGDFRFDERDGGGLVTSDGGATDDRGEDADGAPARRCSNDDVCASLGARCHLESGRCVACLRDGDCTNETAPHCEPTSRVCVACLATADCKSRHRCEPVTHRCIDTCAEGDELCPAAGFVCDELNQRCIECRTRAHCMSSSRGSFCDPSLEICVECAGNASCPPSKPTCDRRTGRCVGCVTADDCPSDSACDPRELVCRRVDAL
jgi:hypothetical protein